MTSCAAARESSGRATTSIQKAQNVSTRTAHFSVPPTTANPTVAILKPVHLPQHPNHKSLNPDAKAILRAADYIPPHELPSDEFPLQLITGRTIYHFHTRTKTGRSTELQKAAPEVWSRTPAEDAKAADVQEGDLTEISTPRGIVQAKARLTGIRRGVLFLPFHYGYWDTTGHAPDGPGHGSKRTDPDRLGSCIQATDLQNRSSRDPPGRLVGTRVEGGVFMKIGTVLAAVHESETALYHRLLALSQQYVTEHEIHHVAKDVAQWSRNHLKDIAELALTTIKP